MYLSGRCLVGWWAEVVDVGPGRLVQDMAVALQRPAGDGGRRRCEDHAPHRAGSHARPHHVQSASYTGFHQFFLSLPSGWPSKKQNYSLRTKKKSITDYDTFSITNLDRDIFRFIVLGYVTSNTRLVSMRQKECVYVILCMCLCHRNRK